MTSYPTELEIKDARLHILWSDGARTVYDPAELRRRCPCAACHRQRETSAAPGEPQQPAGEVSITSMRPVGNYAYHIHFSDGHQTGIYPLEMLRGLAMEP